MAWPQPTDFNEAIQNPKLCFRDPELQGGQVAEDALGMPRPYSGNFADVYQVRSAAGQAWAIKCFTRDVGALQSRYLAISDHLRQGSPPFMVQFHYQAEGIRVGKQWYPIVKMDWVEGLTLNDFVRQHAHRPPVMYRLAQMWVKLSLQLRRANMAHADLQHGNVLLVPGEKASQLSLRLVDYDGMYVPALAKAPSGELGHPNYQHPERLRGGTYHSEIDRFSHLLIYTALRSLTVGGRDLWEKYDQGENLLFRAVDFARPAESQLLLDLWKMQDADLRHLLGHLLIGSQEPPERVVLLDEVVGGEGRPVSLSTAQERLVLELLPPGAARLQALPAAMPRLSLEELVARLDEESLTDAQAKSGLAAVTELPKSSRVALLAAVALGSLLLAFNGLLFDEPMVVGLLNGLAAIGAAVAITLATELLLNAALPIQLREHNLLMNLCWPTAKERCRFCKSRNTIPLFICRWCGHLNWVRLGAVCVFAVTSAALLAISDPAQNGPGWWEFLVALVRALGRLIAGMAAFVVFIGSFEAWKMQLRLPIAGRIQSPAGRLGLWGAILLPLLCAGLLVVSLYARPH